MENNFFDRMNEISDNENKKVIEAQIDEIKRVQQFKVEKLKSWEEAITNKLEKQIEFLSYTEKYAKEIERMIIDIINNSSSPKGKINNMSSYRIGTLDTTDMWNKYDESYETGYEVIKGILVITLNYSKRYGPVGSGGGMAPKINWEYLASILCQNGILIERVQKDGDRSSGEYDEHIDVLRIYCVSKVFYKTHNLSNTKREHEKKVEQEQEN